ncbi:NAD(P)-dependent dehydrogenase, short-chain alcohol dehydrogenase family [Pseudonocardia thermophila]|jgi:Dehydrogenases with different specificities (related to short-chain alcohol dehydrogenases)|uniref:NAD(P)-dependent dehydrogenase, short-chain alcohol dehydrogenase family n=1 Tax=Pseudonocardia thermophila TaxID=1848 RepID=A0A1M6UX41_PSETH|nr:SDR family NAD(P)-dependent oxidoreductase [Pseudonocardia thermophila]SHK73809.1 NAD(P)-dependent dehydrogenase, short-chain alcohol dehydrogenase family [Pseudonocardia thermophila]
MTGMCADRVCVVTGAGRGLGEVHAHALAAAGARVVVNDLGAAKDGTRPDPSVAEAVVEKIRAAGGQAVAHAGDVSTEEGAESLLECALSTWGRLDVVINNAGILRDKMLVNMTTEDWDSVLKVHLRSTFLTSRAAARYWREQHKKGVENDARIVNTTSSSGIYGNVGQSNYGAAKAAIASFTIITSRELERYGITVNAVCPTALTRMTADTRFGESEDARSGVLDPKWVSPVVVWLASKQSTGVTGRVIVSSGRNLAVAEGWRRGPTAPPVESAEDVDGVLRDLLDRAQPNANQRGEVVR